MLSEFQILVAIQLLSAVRLALLLRYESQRLTRDRNWGLAAVYGYHAYGDGDLLDIASQNWNVVYEFFITPVNASRGSHSERNVTFQSVCNNGAFEGSLPSYRCLIFIIATTAGGVFWVTHLFGELTMRLTPCQSRPARKAIQESMGRPSRKLLNLTCLINTG